MFIVVMKDCFPPLLTKVHENLISLTLKYFCSQERNSVCLL